jgi:hypothetical protein
MTDAEATMATPIHDQIMLWLDANMEDVILGFCKTQWTDEDRAEWKKFSGAEPMPEFATPKIAKKTWEAAIGSGEGKYCRIEGHIDLAVRVMVPGLVYSYPDGGVRQTKMSVGLWPTMVFFEVKPKIDSLGEVIRQLRRYQTYASGVWVVVSPDTRYATILREQGIEFLQAPGSTPQLGL